MKNQYCLGAGHNARDDGRHHINVCVRARGRRQMPGRVDGNGTCGPGKT